MIAHNAALIAQVNARNNEVALHREAARQVESWADHMASSGLSWNGAVMAMRIRMQARELEKLLAAIEREIT